MVASLKIYLAHHRMFSCCGPAALDKPFSPPDCGHLLLNSPICDENASSYLFFAFAYTAVGIFYFFSHEFLPFSKQ